MLHNIWKERMQDLILRGEFVHPRGQSTREQLAVQVVVPSLLDNIILSETRGLNYRFMVAEWLWMMFGRSDVESIAQYNSRIAEFSDDGRSFAGAYGPHICAQLPRVIQRLREDPVSRQAVIEIRRPQAVTKDEPCTLSFQFLLRQDRLNVVVTMRSSDVWLGFPYDVFNFTQLANCVAGVLGKQRGCIWLQFGSSHLYERNIIEAARVLHAPASSLSSPVLPGLPPWWLEEVLLKRDARVLLNARDGIDAPVWLHYARALLAPTSKDALQELRLAAGGVR